MLIIFSNNNANDYAYNMLDTYNCYVIIACWLKLVKCSEKNEMISNIFFIIFSNIFWICSPNIFFLQHFLNSWWLWLFAYIYMLCYCYIFIKVCENVEKIVGMPKFFFIARKDFCWEYGNENDLTFWLTIFCNNNRLNITRKQTITNSTHVIFFASPINISNYFF